MIIQKAGGPASNSNSHGEAAVWPRPIQDMLSCDILQGKCTQDEILGHGRGTVWSRAKDRDRELESWG